MLKKDFLLFPITAVALSAVLCLLMNLVSYLYGPYHKGVYNVSA